MSIQSNFPNLQPSLLLDFANTKQLDNRVTFTRSTPAVYYDGVTTAMAEQNLVTWSQDFSDGSWTKLNTTITADTTTAPDGTTTADTINEGTATGAHIVYQSPSSIAGTSYVYSCYIKNVSANYVQLQLWGTASNYAGTEFNLSTGAIVANSASGTGWSVTSSSITSVGNSWYRCVVVIVAGQTGSMGSGICVSDGTSSVDNRGRRSYTGTNRTLYIWGAQFEQRSSATAYTATTSQAITNYIPVLLTAGGNQPRFDCNPTTGESLGLLIEEQRTNLATYSQDFSNANWTNNNLTIDVNTIVAPDGTLTGEKLISTTLNGGHNLQQSFASSPNTNYTISVYLKAGQFSYAYLYIGGTGAGQYQVFNISTGTLGANGAGVRTTTITPVGNGWYRYSLSITTLSSVGGNFVEFSCLPTDSIAGFAGNGFSGAFIWGAQLEVGSFATSYIATTSASATRAQDLAVMTGTNFSSWYSNAEWSLYTEVAFTNTADNAVISIDDNSFNNIARVGAYLNTIYTNVYSNSAFQFNQTPVTSVTKDAFYKIGFAAKPNSYAVIANTNALITQNSGLLFNSSPYQMFIGNTFYGNPFTGRIKKIAYYPIRVSDTNLQALTS